VERDTGGPSAPAEPPVRGSSSAIARDGDLAGRTLGDFVVAEKIGEGGFGAVYRAHQPLLDRPAVIKVLHTRLRATAAATERFLREARLASRLDHPYAAHIYAFGAESDGTLWIAMELVRGTTLSEYLRVHGPLSVERFVPLLERICEVVHSAHEQGIIHRDLKPANVMVVARAGRLLPKLLDLGIAKSLLDVTADDVVDAPVAAPPPRSVRARSDPAIAMDDTMAPAEAVNGPSIAESLPMEPATVVGPRSKISGPRSVEVSSKLTQQGAVMGSPHYMAPEQWLDAGAVTARTDLYALGILAYEALTGAPPFRAGSVSVLAAAHTDDPVPPLPHGLPIALDAALGRALAKRPADRFDSALDLAAAFRTAAGLSAEKRPLPQLDEALRQQYVADAPQPLAEAVSALESARDPRQARDALWAIPTLLGRWLAVVALAARSRLGPGHDGPGAIGAVRELGTSVPDDDAWIEAAHVLLRGYAAKPDLHPIPELVLFACAADGSAGEGLALYRELVAQRPGIAETTANDDEVIARLRPALVTLSTLLRKASFVCSYALVVPAGDGFADRWSGIRRTQRVQVVARGNVQAHVPMLVDENGAPVVALQPIVQIAEPAPGVAPELFVFAGRDARGVKLSAPPTAFERHDPAVLDWLRVQMASTLDPDRGAAATERAPYRGLAAFTADDAALFVGREQQVDAFVNRLRMQPLVAVVGPSGAGKSSFVQAGVIPALGETWRSIIVRPGPAPLVSLASRVVAAGIRAHDLASRLRDDPARLGDLLRDHAAEHGPILLVIDQLEELFTLVHDDAERQSFALAIVSAARAVDDPVRVVMTLRDDFLATTQSLASLRDRFAHGLQLLTTPSRDDLERILVEPARRLGYEFEDPALPARMVEEVADRPGALALLSFTAAQLWEERDRHFRRLPTKAYEALGGVGGALARHADAVLEAASAHEQKLIREAFRHLVTAGGTRAVLTRQELATVMGDSAAADSVIERLVASRLLVAREGETDEQIEIAHEALIHAWPRLVEWQREDVEGARLRDQLRAAARQWDERGRPRGLLWRDEALVEYQLWRARYPGTLTEIEDGFARASVADAARGRRLRRGILVTVLALLAGAVAVLIYARDQAAAQRETARAAAVQERERSRVEILERARLAVLDNRGGEARTAIDEALRLGTERTAALDVLDGAAAQVERARVAILRGHDNAIEVARIDARGERVVSAAVDGTVLLWDLPSRRVLRTLTECQTRLWGASFDPPGDRFAIDCGDGRVYVYSRDGGLQHALRACEVCNTEVVASAFAPASRRIVTVGGAAVRMWDVDTGGLVWAASRERTQERVAVSRDGSVVATVELGASTAAGAGVNLWDAASGTWLRLLHTGYVRAMKIDPSSTWLLAAGNDKVVRVWRLRDGALQRSLVGHSAWVELAAFSPDGAHVATASRDGTVRLWHAEGTPNAGELAISWATGAGFVTDMAFDATGRLVAGTSDGMVYLWDTTTTTMLASLEATAGVPVRSVGFDAQGRHFVAAGDDRLVHVWRPDATFLRATLSHGARVFDTVVADEVAYTFGADGTVKRWDLRRAAVVAEVRSEGEIEAPAVSAGGAVIWGDSKGNVYRWTGGGPAAVLARHAGFVRSLALAPDGRVVASGGADANVLLTPVAGGPSIRIEQHAPDVWGLAFSADGTRLATGDGAGRIRTFRVDGTPVATLPGHKDWIPALRYTRDGRLVSASADTTARVWSARGELVHVLEGHGRLIGRLTLDPAQSRLLTSSPDGTARIWDLDTGAEVTRLQDHGVVLDATFVRDGTLVVTVGESAVVRVWDARSGRELLRLWGHTDLIWKIVATSDDRLVTSGFDGKTLIWQLPRSR
jgi:WD40 repeat protein/serine/threonine protein kinase